MHEDKEHNTGSEEKEAAESKVSRPAKKTSSKASSSQASSVKTSSAEKKSEASSPASQASENQSSKFAAGMEQAGQKIAQTLQTAQEHLKDDADQVGKVITKEDDHSFILMLYGLCVAGFMMVGGLGVAVIVALILTSLKKKSSDDDWADTHLSFLSQTLWIGFAGLIFGFILCLTEIGFFIGFPLMVAASVWAVARGVTGALWAFRKKPYPNPGSWLI